jgi:hypothetical protein
VRWLHYAVGESWSFARNIAAIFTLLFTLTILGWPSVESYLLTWGPRVADVAWYIAFAVFCALVAVKLFLVPYQLDQEREQQITDLTQKQDQQVKDLSQERERQVTAIRDTAQQTEAALRQRIGDLERQLDTRASRRAHREAIAQLIRDGERVRGQYVALPRVADDAADDWTAAMHNYLRTHFDDSYIVRVESRTGPPPDPPPWPELAERNRKTYEDLSYRIAHLHTFLRELS